MIEISLKHGATRQIFLRDGAFESMFHSKSSPQVMFMLGLIIFHDFHYYLLPIPKANIHTMLAVALNICGITMPVSIHDNYRLKQSIRFLLRVSGLTPVNNGNIIFSHTWSNRRGLNCSRTCLYIMGNRFQGFVGYILLVPVESRVGLAPSLRPSNSQRSPERPPNQSHTLPFQNIS